MLETIKALCEINAPSGREGAVREYIISKISSPYTVDAAGNLIVYKEGRQRAKKKVMFAAHMDEVGIIATGADAEGFIKFAATGAIDPKVLLGKRVIFDNGTYGVAGLKPVHLIDRADRGKMPAIDAMYIDIGAKDKAEAEKHVSPGQAGVFASGFTAFGDHKIKSKALDDRVGCAILLDMINSDLEYGAVFAFTVKEEVGLIGAAAAAFGVEPDFAVVLETTTAADIAGVSGEKRVCVLGEGAAVSFMDRTTVYSPELFRRVFEIAEKKGIKAQPKTVVAGGNDAGPIHKSRAGVPTITLNTPCRYIHSPSCVADTRDIGELRKLAEACLYDFI